jgi:hypothetical protein
MTTATLGAPTQIEAPQIAAPTAQQSAPLFLGTTQVSDRVKLLFDNLELSELQRRSLLAYNMTDDELVEDLLSTPRELLHATPRFDTPQRLMRELHVVEHDGDWFVVNGLSQIKSGHYTQADAKIALTDLITDLITELTGKLAAMNSARLAFGLDPIDAEEAPQATAAPVSQQ